MWCLSTNLYVHITQCLHTFCLNIINILMYLYNIIKVSEAFSYYYWQYNIVCVFRIIGRWVWFLWCVGILLDKYLYTRIIKEFSYNSHGIKCYVNKAINLSYINHRNYMYSVYMCHLWLPPHSFIKSLTWEHKSPTKIKPIRIDNIITLLQSFTHLNIYTLFALWFILIIKEV